MYASGSNTRVFVLRFFVENCHKKEYRNCDTRLPKSERDAKSEKAKNLVDSLHSCNEEQLNMKMELARLQKEYRETRKRLNRLTQRKHISSSVTR